MADKESGRGFVKMYRKMTEWEWYSDIIVKTVFIHCLLKANYKEKRWRGYTIKRGQFITSYPKLAKECGITVSQARRAISALCSTGEITRKAQAKFSMVTVIGYDSYQSDNSQSNSQSNSQATGKQQQHKNIKNDKERKEYKKEPNPYVDINTMSIIDFDKYDEWNREHGIEG
jgi:hypothetical protein